MIRSEIRTNAENITRETGITTIINNFINRTILEIQDPAWCFSASRRRPHHHLWNFNRRKTTLTTVASQEDYQLPRDLDKIGLIRQTTSPTKLVQVPDEIFYRLYPNPTAEGNPRFYRIWEHTGVSTDLSTDDAISIVSDNSTDTTQKISVSGYRTSDGMRDSEEISLNGTTTVNGTITFKSGRPLRISKSADTTGVITIKEKTSGTTLLQLGPQERASRFKEISFYPIPSSAITINIEYYTRLRILNNDTDAPDLPEKWHWVIEAGTIAKIREYQQNETQYFAVQKFYAQGVQSMIESDQSEFDLIEYLKSSAESRIVSGPVKLSDTVASGFDGSAFGIKL